MGCCVTGYYWRLSLLTVSPTLAIFHKIYSSFLVLFLIPFLLLPVAIPAGVERVPGAGQTAGHLHGQGAAEPSGERPATDIYMSIVYGVD